MYAVPPRKSSHMVTFMLRVAAHVVVMVKGPVTMTIAGIKVPAMTMVVRIVVRAAVVAVANPSLSPSRVQSGPHLSRPGISL